MFQDDSTKCKVDWSNLPHDLLSQIASSLGPFGYLSLCLVCKDWRNATLKASREHKFSRCDPCFLLYGGESSQCTLLSNTDNISTIDIPELDGATCLASYEGWLLVFRDGLLFFFCPFSKAKLELPNCPFKELSEHIAAFSSPPTSRDCIVVVTKITYSCSKFYVHTLCRGDSIWVKHNISHLCCFSLSTGLQHVRGDFIFDGANTKKGNSLCFPKIVYPTITSKDVRRKLGLNTNVSISTCGTLHLRTRKFPTLVFEIDYIKTVLQGSHLKGVWVLPRYHHIPADQNW